MRMFIGGVCQGKRDLASKLYPSVSWAFGESCTREELFEAEGVYAFHKYIYREMKAGRDVSSLALELTEKNPDIIIISDEVGYGVVPMDAFERAYREAVGRICTELASFSSSVTRVVCGIGTVIKDA